MEVLTVVLSSTLIATVISKLIDMLSNRKLKKSAEIINIGNRLEVLEKANMFLLLGEIKTQGKEYIAQGYITSTDLEAFEQLYQLYHKPKEEGGLGGNGFAKNIYDKVTQLDIKVEE